MQKIYATYLDKLPKEEVNAIDKLHLLTDEERLKIRKVYRKYIWQAAILGALGVVFYFAPLHFFPSIFPKTTITAFFEQPFELAYGEIIWGIFLMIIELHLLVLVNLKAVNALANATGFYQNQHQKSDFLLQLGLDAKDLGLNDYGIDPYQEVNKNILFVFNLILKLKGFLANKLLQYLVKRLLGRYAVRYVVDYVGIPIYMTINAYATYVILNKTKICIMGSNLVSDFMQNLPKKTLRIEEKELIYDTLQLVAMSKRDYHKNHFLLTEALFNHFEIEKKEKHIFQPKFYENLAHSTEFMQKTCNELILLGFVLDGKISKNEAKKIKTLQNHGILNESIESIRTKTNNFLNGKNFDY